MRGPGILAACVALAVMLWPASSTAQEAVEAGDKDFLTRFLETNLSSAGRQVSIDGFAGALSSRATFRRLSISDDQGVWLVIQDGAIAWNRAALLSGRVEIAEMSAAEIDIQRKPDVAGGAEDKGFALPDLPVALSIDALDVGKVRLGQAILGEALVFSAAGKASLAAGAGTAEFRAARMESGVSGEFSVTASYSNTTRVAALDFLAAEGAGGIVADLVGLPGRPSVTLAMHGSGRIDAFALDLALSTDGAPRLAGRIGFGAAGGDLTQGQKIDLALRGDVRPLFQPDYRAFFGADAQVLLDGRRFADGRVLLDGLELTSQALRLAGSGAIGADGRPERIALTAQLGDEAAPAVALPVPGPPTLVRTADLSVAFDAARGEDWRLEGSVLGLDRAGVRADRITLTASGRLRSDLAGGTIDFVADGLDTDDAGLATAIGRQLSGRAVFNWARGQGLRLPQLALNGNRLTVAGRATVGAGQAQGSFDLVAADLSRFAKLSGRDLAGAAELSLEGVHGLSSGRTTIALRGQVTGLGTGIADLDRLTAGRVVLAGELERTGAALDIRSARISADGLVVTAQGRALGPMTDLTAQVSLDTLGRMRPGLGGGVAATLRATGPADALRLGLDGDVTDLRTGQAGLDSVLAGNSSMTAEVLLGSGRPRLGALDFSGSNLTLSLRPSAAPDTLDVTARLARTEALAPELPGPITLKGTIGQTDGYAVELGLTGPGRADLRLAGTVARDGAVADLVARGQIRAEVANAFIAPRAATGTIAFDLRLSGALRAENLVGQITAQGARVADPTLFVAVEDVLFRADIAKARATLSASGRFRDGGRLSVAGSLGLGPGLPADLTVSLDQATLRDPALFQTTATGTLRLSGPVARGGAIAGDIRLDQTEIRVAAAGSSGAGLVTGVTHRNEPEASRASRARAGLVDDGQATERSGRGLAIDIGVSAPQRLFVRGRGLDAELGGQVRLTGTSAAIVPSGEFRLIRGRLDILSKRLTIDAGTVELRGALEPYLSFAASNASDGVTTTVTLEGPASAPQIRFTSVPELPEEEVVSHLLFGRGVQTLSAFQAAELAAAVATLAGKGGEGITTRLRRILDVDDLDITADETGGTSFRAGKYINERVYTDVTVDGEGRTEINLNLDVTESLTARGTVDNEGSTGLGIFFEKDY